MSGETECTATGIWIGLFIALPLCSAYLLFQLMSEIPARRFPRKDTSTQWWTFPFRISGYTRLFELPDNWQGVAPVLKVGNYEWFENTQTSHVWVQMITLVLQIVL
jgi:hypothetical protein